MKSITLHCKQTDCGSTLKYETIIFTAAGISSLFFKNLGLHCFNIIYVFYIHKHTPRHTTVLLQICFSERFMFPWCRLESLHKASKQKIKNVCVDDVTIRRLLKLYIYYQRCLLGSRTSAYPDHFRVSPGFL